MKVLTETQGLAKSGRICKCGGRGPNVRFSGMFLFELNSHGVTVHIPQVATHAYAFAYRKNMQLMERNEVWDVNTNSQCNGNTDGLICPVIKDFLRVESTLRHCKINMPTPCCVKSIRRIKQFVAGPLKQTGRLQLFLQFDFRYPKNSSLTIQSEAGFSQRFTKGRAVFYAEPMPDMSHEPEPHVRFAMKDLSRMACKSETIVVGIARGGEIQHCFSAMVDNN